MVVLTARASELSTLVARIAVISVKHDVGYMLPILLLVAISLKSRAGVCLLDTRRPATRHGVVQQRRQTASTSLRNQYDKGVARGN